MMIFLFPLLLFATSFWSFLWYQKSHNDIFGVLSVTSAIAGLIWGLIVVHWSINLLGLFLLLLFRSSLFNPLSIKITQE